MNQEIQTRVGESFDVVLESNATTGFTWEFKPSPESQKLVELTGSTYEANQSKVGAPGLQRFRFRALEEGHVDLVFWYRRPWEKGPPREERTVAARIAGKR